MWLAIWVCLSEMNVLITTPHPSRKSMHDWNPKNIPLLGCFLLDFSDMKERKCNYFNVSSICLLLVFNDMCWSFVLIHNIWKNWLQINKYNSKWHVINTLQWDQLPKFFFFKLLLCFLTQSILRHCTVVTTNNTNRQNLVEMVDTQPTKCGWIYRNINMAFTPMVTQQ